MSHETFSADVPPAKSNRGCMIASIVAGALLVCGLCCGGFSWFGFNKAKGLAGEAIAVQLNENPVVQEHAGQVTATLNFTETTQAGQAQPGVQVYDFQGTKANGQAKLMVTNTQPPRIVSGTITLDSGETYDLVPAADESKTDESKTDEPKTDEPPPERAPAAE